MIVDDGKDSKNGDLISVVKDVSTVVSQPVHLAHEKCLLSLAAMKPLAVCNKAGCSAPVVMTSKSVGSALIITWVGSYPLSLLVQYQMFTSLL